MLLIKRYDHNRDGILNFTEVCDIFKPKDLGLSNLFIARSSDSNYIPPASL